LLTIADLRNSDGYKFKRGLHTMKSIVVAALLALSFTTGFTCSKNTPAENATPAAQEQMAAPAEGAAAPAEGAAPAADAPAATPEAETK
jgi:hypothetical protein